MLNRFGFVLSSTLWLAGCGSDGNDEKPEPRRSGSAVLTDAARVLDEPGHAALQRFSAEGQLIFSGDSPVLSQLASGQVLIVSVTNATPYGALVMVEDVTRNGSELVVETRRASLGEAFEELHLGYEATLTVPSPQRMQRDGRGLRSLQQNPVEQRGLAFPLRLESSEASGSALLEGSLSLAPDVDLTIDIDFLRLRLEELSLAFGAAETFTANFTARGTTRIDESVTLATIPFAPIVFPLPGPVSVPIVLTPTLSIAAGVSGAVEGNVETSVVQEASFEVGLGYRNGSFGTLSDHDSKFDVEQPTYDASANVKAVAGPRFEVLLWGLVGPFARAEAYVELSASAEGPPPCVRGSVDAGLGATVGVELIADYETSLFNQNYPLAHFDSCTSDPNAPRPAPTWARSLSRAGSPGDRAKAVVQLADGTYFVVGDSDIVGPVTGFAASIWAVRLDALGNVMWQRAFAGRAQQGRTQGATSVEDGLLVVGNAGIMKLDFGGNLIWAKTYTGPPLELSSLDVHADGKIVAAGTVGTASREAFAMGLDAAGEVLWARGYGGADFARVRTTRDGGSVLVGAVDANNGDLYAVKLDTAGNVSWQRAVDNAHDPTAGMYPNPPVSAGDRGYDIAEKPGGGFIAVGQSYGAFPIPEVASGGYYAAWEVELGADGSLVTSRVHRAPNDALYTNAYAVAVRPDGSSLIVGQRADQSTDLLETEDILLIQGGTFSALGGAGNDAVLAGALAGRAAPFQLTKDGGAIIAATSTSFAGQDQFWVVKLGRTANINFPFRAGLAGSSYTNEHSRSVALSSGATDVQVRAASFTSDMVEEVTPVTVLKQTP